MKKPMFKKLTETKPESMSDMFLSFSKNHASIMQDKKLDKRTLKGKKPSLYSDPDYISPKDQLLVFAKYTNERGDELFKFLITGNTDDAEKYVHAMRSALSRYRNAIIKLGNKPRIFTMKIEKINEKGRNSEGIRKTEILLRRQESRKIKITNDVLELFTQNTEQ